MGEAAWLAAAGVVQHARRMWIGQQWLHACERAQQTADLLAQEAGICPGGGGIEQHQNVSQPLQPARGAAISSSAIGLNRPTKVMPVHSESSPRPAVWPRAQRVHWQDLGHAVAIQSKARRHSVCGR
jgi:hypothetical protein